MWVLCFFFQAEDGIRDLVRSRGLGDVYKRQVSPAPGCRNADQWRVCRGSPCGSPYSLYVVPIRGCLLYKSDAADERSSVDLGGRRIIKKKKREEKEKKKKQVKHKKHASAYYRQQRKPH